jgi:signal transduction histidine kinase
MGDRTLEAKLTLRVLVVTGLGLILVSVAAVVVTDRVLDASDTSSAQAIALSARDMLQRELREGDSLPKALDELVAGTQAEGQPLARVTARAPGEAPRASGAVLPAVEHHDCATLLDEAGRRWRACEATLSSVSVVAAIPIDRHHHAVWALARGMTGVVLSAVLLLWFALKLAVRGPVAELAALVAWTSRILETEDSAPPPHSHTREVAHLSRAFDALVRRMLEVLARERASSAHIAHELRTPLTAMCAELDSLVVTDPSARRVIDRVRADIARFADVIEAILVLSSSGQTRRSEVVVNVADLARELAPDGAQVLAPDEALVEADEPLLTLALRNLIENAQRHGDGVRSVRVSRDGDSLRLAVTDAGPGLDEAARTRMFERYWRASADGPGRGLGLALVQAVAERHGGTARAEPGPSGRGLCVSMTLGRLLEWHDEDRPCG